MLTHLQKLLAEHWEISFKKKKSLSKRTRIQDKFYNSCVAPILDYSSSLILPVRRLCAESGNEVLLGVHRFAPTLVMTGDTGWILSMYRRWTSMVRFLNRILDVRNDRLVRRIFEEDYRHCKNV